MIASYNWESDSFTQHTETPAWTSFREAVLQVAEKAKAILPANASRIDKAIALTLNGLVEIVDGKCRVASQTNGKTIYHQVSVAERLTEGLYSASEPDRTGTMLS
jgi:hypothetical protein